MSRKITSAPVKKNFIAVLLCFAAVVPAVAQKADKRLVESTAVLKTIMSKKEISDTAWSKAVCVLVFPSVRRVGVGIGVTYGRGVLVCRTGTDMRGKWGAPIMYSLDVGSLGAQLGTTSTDYVLLVVSQRGAQKILSGKLKLGAGASAVAGPSGANATVYNDPNVDILSYSQSKGLFAGAALGSASMGSDDKANKELYGKDITDTAIQSGEVTTPASAQPLIRVLKQAAPTRA
jgi:SH3 domain-containing YSC84-like protein 1